MTNYRIDDENNAELQELRNYWDSNINKWWMDAQLHGTYPQNLVELYGDKLSKVVKPGDMEALKIDSEFLGINYYSDSFLNRRNTSRTSYRHGLANHSNRSN
jgi:beta-glucosidase